MILETRPSAPGAAEAVSRRSGVTLSVWASRGAGSGTLKAVPYPTKEETMPRFYINFHNRDQKTKHNVLARDDVGIDVPDLEEARKAALISAREIVADNVKGGTIAPLVTVVITDHNGQVVMTISAKDVLPEPLKH
jgi:hypothetical protein